MCVTVDDRPTSSLGLRRDSSPSSVFSTGIFFGRGRSRSPTGSEGEPNGRKTKETGGYGRECRGHLWLKRESPRRRGGEVESVNEGLPCKSRFVSPRPCLVPKWCVKDSRRRPPETPYTREPCPLLWIRKTVRAWSSLSRVPGWATSRPPFQCTFTTAVRRIPDVRVFGSGKVRRDFRPPHTHGRTHTHTHARAQARTETAFETIVQSRWIVS